MGKGKAKVSFDAAGLIGDIKAYGKALGKSRGEALQRQSVNFTIKAKSELKRLSPKKTDVSLQALAAQKKRGTRKGGSRQVVSLSSTKDLESGKVLGLKIRPSVASEARVKFKYASSIASRRRSEKRGKKLRSTKFGPKRTVKRGGKDLTITAWMISREIAVRRSGIGYLAYGFGFRGFKRTDKPRDRKITHRNRKKVFISKIDQTEKKNLSSVRILDRVPGTSEVNRKRRVFEKAGRRTRLDMKTHLLTKAISAKKTSFKGRRRAKR